VMLPFNYTQSVARLTIKGKSPERDTDTAHW
jgi:hypothetical protein